MKEIRDAGGRLCHLIHRAEDFRPGRKDLIKETEFLQCAVLQFNWGKTFRPHRHVWRSWKGLKIAQESWVVISGSVHVTFYDKEGELITTDVLRQGDASFTLEGGHNYMILEDQTKVYEFKTGPYLGQEHDKVFL